MRSFIEAAGIGVGNEGAVEMGIEDAIDGVVQESVANSCFVDIAGLGVADTEMRVRTMTICACGEICMKRGDVFNEVILERLHVPILLLAAQELLPRVEQVVGGNDTVVRMRDADSTHPSERTTPRQFRKKNLYRWC